MRMKILKIVVVLLLSGSGDARPQRTEESIQAQPSKATPEEWRASGASQTVREDSRYTWNSGSSTIPYTNYNRDNVDPFVERDDEVSVDKTRRLTSTDVQRPNSNHFWNSSRSQLKNPRKIIDRSTLKASQQVAGIFHEQPIKNYSLARLRNKFRRHGVASTLKGTILGNSSKNSTNSSLRKPDQKFSSSYTRVPLLNSRISYPNRVTNKSNSTKNGFTSDSIRDSPWRRTNEVPMNNSRPNGAALSQNSEFSDQKEAFSSAFYGAFAKVESTTPFDHVAAIKNITGMLTHEQTTSELSLENKNSIDHGVPFVPLSQKHSNRHWISKHSNRTKISRPVVNHANSNKKNQNKVNSNKVQVNKNGSSTPNTNLKNWPNGAIQNADDFHNYDKYTSIEGNSKPEEVVQGPLPMKNSTFNYHVPVSSPSLQEIVHWLKIPAFMTNGSHVIESDQINGPISVTFDPNYQNLEPNKPSKPVSLQNLKPGFIYPLHATSHTTEKVPSWLGNGPLRNKTQIPVIHNPQTQVSQNTVVHLINTDLRKPNRTSVGSKIPPGFIKPIVSSSFVPPSGSSPSLATSGPGSYPSSLIFSQLPLSSSTTTKPGPNVHIGFTSYEENKVPDQQAPQTPVVTYDQRCPTILINSYTRINNTIQSKEGCTDLNIIINSHVFNTNTYKSTPSPLSDPSNSGSYQTYGEVDKYDPGGQIDPASVYQSIPIYQSSSPGSQWPQNSYYDPQKDPQTQVLHQNDVSNVEVIQDTQISISGPSSAEASPQYESSLAEIEDTSPLGDNPSGSSAGGSEIGQANDSPGGSSLVRPAVAPGVSNSGSSGASPTPTAGLAIGSSPPSRPANDDDDDDYDLSPTGIMDSIASVFTYFTFVNPLHYGFFSLAAAPFTALAAGVLGIVTFIYPWLFPSSFGFSRANNNAADSFWFNLEEVVRQSMEKYGRVNEWKSKRKKRKR